MHKDAPLDPATADWAAIDRAINGFVFEAGDKDEYGSFEKFQKHIAESTLSSTWDAAKDQADVQYEAKRLESDIQKHAMDNQTKIAIENSKLTHQVITDIASQQLPEAAPTMGAPTAEMPPQGMPQGMPQPQGVPNVNI
jgi:hypothetical protein